MRVVRLMAEDLACVRVEGKEMRERDEERERTTPVAATLQERAYEDTQPDAEITHLSSLIGLLGSRLKH